MNWTRNITLSALSSLFLLACDAQITSGKEDNIEVGLSEDQQNDLLQLQQATGGTASIELNRFGNVRKLFMEPGFPLRSFTGTPSKISQDFIREYKNLFRLDDSQASQFFATREDIDIDGVGSTVTLQRFVAGFPVYQGAININLDNDGGITDVLGDPSYGAGAPTNELAITPDDAAVAAASFFGIDNLAPQLVGFEDIQSTFSSTKASDISVEPRVFQMPESSEFRFAYQVLLSWNDADTNELRYELAVVDATSREVLSSHSLVHDFRGLVFTSKPTGTGDARVTVSFDGDPTASPSGWVDGSRSTRGNNAVAATDFNADNFIGGGEIQPVANANNDFFFNFANNQSAQNFPSAAAVNVFYLVNDFHDKLYSFGFTEAAGNFQTNNFGRGGRGNDAVRIDVQDGSGTNNANFATPPDGQPPRMQMFLFQAGGPLRDSDFDASVVYHENAHGLSTRLVGGGSPGCLSGVQSGGMGEGWSDFVAAMLLGDSVIGAYVTGNNASGIRRANMATSTFSYSNLKNGQLTAVHDVGEIWAATLFDIRETLGATNALRLVVRGMKLTPCQPSMLDARDGIMQADRVLSNGANRCVLEQIFASRAMGVNASSPSHNSISGITTSAAISSVCQGNTGGGNTGGGSTGGLTLSSGDLPVAIPDNNNNGASSTINIPSNLDVQRILIDTRITHSFRGDLQVFLIAPDQTFATLSDQAGGSADNFNLTSFDATDLFSNNTPGNGNWTLFVRDVASGDAGVFNQFRITVVGASGQVKTFSASSAATGNIPDASNVGVRSTISSNVSGLQIQTVQVKLNITHTFRGDVQVFLTSPAGESRTVVAPASNDSVDNIIGTFNVAGFTNGTNGNGTWTLTIIDRAAGDIGRINGWSLGVNTTAP